MTSASAQARAEEFNGFVRDPQVRAVVPPGELAVDLVDLRDVDALRAKPTWIVGWSDISTMPLTLCSGVVTVHGQNLMDTPYALPRGMAHGLDTVALERSESFTQRDPGVRRRGGFDDWEAYPQADRHDLSDASSWRVLQGPPKVEMTGRLISGCLDVVCHLAGTPYGEWVLSPGRMPLREPSSISRTVNRVRSTRPACCTGCGSQDGSRTRSAC